MNGSLPILLLGFFLGIKHAFDADHVIAVTTIVSKHKNPLKAALIGTFWGLGHTTSLFLTGLIILLLKVSIPAKISLILEGMVGLMLVYLGLKVLINKEIEHLHQHDHDIEMHSHRHDHNLTSHFHQHKKSFFIGVFHGLAGSGALMIMVLSTIKSTVEGLYYILLFGLGSIGAMTTISLAIGFPFIYSAKKFPLLNRKLNLAAGIFSIAFGIFIVAGSINLTFFSKLF